MYGRALVFMCHGAGEHCLYYGEIAELLKAKDIFVFGHDHRKCSVMFQSLVIQIFDHKSNIYSFFSHH